MFLSYYLDQEARRYICFTKHRRTGQIMGYCQEQTENGQVQNDQSDIRAYYDRRMLRKVTSFLFLFIWSRILRAKK